MKLPDRLQDAIDAFKKRDGFERYYTMEGAFCQCVDVSLEFLHFCRNEQFFPELTMSVIEFTDPPAGAFDKAHPTWREWERDPGLNRREFNHALFAVRIGLGWYYVDFSARQFDPHAPVPVIYTRLRDVGWGSWRRY